MTTRSVGPAAVGSMVRVNDRARRAQQALALAVVVGPMLGVLAVVLLWRSGIPVSGRDLVLFTVMFLVTGIGVEAGFHRYFSHGSFKASPAMRAFLAIAGSMAGQGPVIFWATTHRRHHAFSDRSGDPHSPHWFDGRRLSPLAGLWHAHVGWLFVHEITDWTRFGPDLVKDRRLFRLNQSYLPTFLAGLVLPAIVGGLWGGSWMAALTAMLWGGPVRVFALHHTTWSVNSLCHVFGRQPLRVRDRSANVWWLALLSFGGSWHNNHHAFPSLAKNNIFWWQLDPSGWFVTLAEKTRLVWDARSPTDKMRRMASTGSSGEEEEDVRHR